ncbi:MAG: CmcJ/NvfI family oxidoreductase [Gammaproteobacteria bacterium]
MDGGNMQAQAESEIYETGISARADCPSVESSVNYLGDMDEMPVFYAENYRNDNLNLIEHNITVSNARPVQDHLELERDGFVLADHATAVRDFRDTDEVQRTYVPEIEALIRDLTGAPKVLVAGAVLRWGERAEESGTATVNSRPARFVHVDYSRRSFDDFARMHLDNAGEAEPEKWLGGRYVAYNIWRVLTPPPQDVPLGICAAWSTAPEDVVTGEAVIDAPDAPEFRFGSSLYRYNPDHHWFYFADMHPGETLVFKAFDTDRARLQGCPHSAFNNPHCPEEAPPRASVEIRAYAYFGS